MLIPTYLKDITIYEDSDKYKGNLKVKCTCGCQQFFVYKNIKKRNKISNEDRKKIKATELWENEVFFPLITNYGESGEKKSAVYIDYPQKKYREIVIYNSTSLLTQFDMAKDKERIIKIFKVNYGEVPLSIDEIKNIEKYDNNIIIKVKCFNCNNEYVLFDSRIHGCDAADFVNEKLEQYDYKQIKVGNRNYNNYQIMIYIENYWDIEDNIDYSNNLIDIDYSNMFNYIKIQIINSEKKKITIFSDELG